MTDFEIAARFSPGPWWGFNGVDELKLSSDVLTRKHYRVFRGKVPVTSPLSSVEVVSREVRLDKRSGRPNWVRMTLMIDGARTTFTGHANDGKSFADALAEATSRSGR
ncbi:hypothetical protein GCM10022256_05190 [Frondihabitans peucedani]|uniref:Uncharacterized protein n=1 Tax=Frondihabitans peucedani TaxID=598626 RepID=A0ABP8DYB0_9MICO